MLRFLGEERLGEGSLEPGSAVGKKWQKTEWNSIKNRGPASGAVVLGQWKGVRCRNVPVKSNANRSLFERANYIQLFREKLSEKCTRQSRRVLLVVLSLRQLQSPGTVYWSYRILPFGIVACTFFPTTFLQITAYNNYSLKWRRHLSK